MRFNFLDNICLLTDSYKPTHWLQYPPGTQSIYSYLAARKGAEFDETCFFGLQYFLRQYLEGRVVSMEKLNEAQGMLARHFGRDLFNFEGWRQLWRKHGGRLPVVIRAVPEGTVIPVGDGNVLMTIQNTDLEFPWLTNYLETLLVQVWGASTVATQSRFMKKTILRYLQETGDPGAIDFKLHDFGVRGVSCPEEAAVAGAGHLVNFKGSDNLPAVLLHRAFYDCPMAGFSIPASEHSTITAWGDEKECEAMANMLDAYPDGLVACVSDSYDVFRACRDYWGDRLRDRILARDGVLVIRPDSGDAANILPQLMHIIAGKFGHKLNSKGYRVLHPHVRFIQGDGIDRHSLGDILESVKLSGWSADNIGFGSGGGLLRRIHRDTQRIAMKGSWALVNGEARDVMKSPVTDPAKASKGGRLKLVSRNGVVTTVSEHDEGSDWLIEVFRDGEIKQSWTLDEIRKRAAV